jgi:hypothetical protein
LVAAAACLLTAPAIVQPASAETYIRSSDGWRHDDNWRHRGYHSRASVVVTSPHHCRMTTVRTKHGNGSVSIRKIRKCY